MHLYVDQVPCNMLIRWFDITRMVEVALTRPPYAVGCARRLSVNHVVASTTASWEWCYSDKHLVKAMSLSVIKVFVCAILDKCWGLLRDIPANKVLSSTATSIRACQLQWASVSLIAHSLLQMRRKSPLFPRSGVVARARALPHQMF